MTLREIVALTVRLGGILLLVLVVAKIPEYARAYLYQESAVRPEIVWYFLFPLLIPALIALLFCAFPMKVADMVIVSETPLPRFTEIAADLEPVLIRLLGLLLLYWTVSDALFHAANYMTMRDYSDRGLPVSIYNYPNLFATLGEFVFSLWLLIGTKNVIRLLRRMRGR